LFYFSPHRTIVLLHTTGKTHKSLPIFSYKYCITVTALPDFNNIGATTVGTGGDWSPTFRLGTNHVLVPQLLDRSFQKARNFTV